MDSRESPQLAVKAFLTQNQNKMGTKKPHSHKKHLFRSFFFSNGKGKTTAFDKEKGETFPPWTDYEYIPCEQMAEFPVVALWGNENAELLLVISLVWGSVCVGGLVERAGHAGVWELSF